MIYLRSSKFFTRLLCDKADEAKMKRLFSQLATPPVPPPPVPPHPVPPVERPSDLAKQIEDNLYECRNAAAMQGRIMGPSYMNPNVSSEVHADITRQMAYMHSCPGYFDPV